MSGILAHAAMIQDWSFELIRQEIADDEYLDDLHDPDPGIADHAKTEHARIMAMNNRELQRWLYEYAAEAASESDWIAIAYTMVTCERLEQLET